MMYFCIMMCFIFTFPMRYGIVVKQLYHNCTNSTIPILLPVCRIFNRGLSFRHSFGMIQLYTDRQYAVAQERIMLLARQHPPNQPPAKPPADMPAPPQPQQATGQQGASDAAFPLSAAMALSTRDGKLLFLDPAVLSLLDITQESISGCTVFDLLADSHDQYAIQTELKVRGTVEGFQSAFNHANGLIIPVCLSIQPITLNGKKYLVILFSFDNRAERQQQTESRYHLIFNNVPVGIAITDSDGNFYAFNPAFTEMMAYPPLQMRELTAYAMYQNADDRRRLIAQLFRDNTVRNFETTFVRKDGKPIQVLLNADVITFGHLKNALLASIRDISSQKSIEAKLIKERDFSEAILNTSDSLIMVYSKDGRMIKFNKACEKATGYTLDELQETPFWELLAPDAEQAGEPLPQIGDPHFENSECYWKAKNGRIHLIKWASTALVDEDGHDYIVSTGSDITESRKAHEAVREANRQLEKSLRNLEEQNQAISLLADMEGYLQGCHTVEEACTICAQFVQSICPESNGAVYLIDGSPDPSQAQAQEAWGDESISQKLFTPTSCWSVRRGRHNLIDANHRGLPCPHIHAVPGGQYLCIPMEANGDLLGILHISYISGPAAEDNPAAQPPYFESRLRLLTTAAETASLSLANIMLQQSLRQQSIRDVLTGIYNRRYMVESLFRELSRAQREQAPVSVLMFDIDHFKDFNDTYGHDGGDTLLRYLGEFLKQNTRGEDIVCRYGGEEFVVVLPNTRHQSAVEKANELRIGISQLQVPHLGTQMRTCTISIGVATYPQSGHTADELLKAADDALYAAKRGGRNRVVSCQEI